ncbi:MAG: lytic transglycosylase domain-containing protein [Pseudomonadota bacterium]
MRARIIVLWPIVFALWGAHFAWGATETLHIPIVLDYPFIRAVVVYQTFTGAGEKAVPLKDGKGYQVEIWAPEISSEGTYLKLGTHIRALGGTSLPGKRKGNVVWEGYLEVLQRVHFDPDTRILRFETVKSRLYDRNRKRAGVAAVLWDSIKGRIYPFLDRISIDLSGPLTSLKDFLPTVFTRAARDRAERMLQSIRVDQVAVGKDAIKVSLSMEVEPLAAPPEPSPKLSAEQVERFIQIWESWDAYLIYQIESLFHELLTPDERRTIRDTLVENRQAFVKVMTDEKAGNGFIEAQFRKTWEQLVPIFRKHLGRKPSSSLLTLLSFFTASDALFALSDLGSRLGLEISRDGFLRLAGLINPDGVAHALDYHYAVSPELRRFLGLGPPLDESGPAYDVDELDLPDDGPDKPSEDINGSWLFPGISQAFAGERINRSTEEIKAWLPPKGDTEAYRNRVKQLLEESAERFLQEVDKRHQAIFAPLVLATAWQESCWRQFVLKNGKLTYLRSTSGASAGIMQINERVWRGIYRVESLRWNIEYNARAGCEIFSLYFNDKVLSDKKNPGSLDEETVACGVYAMYNSGPGGFSDFLKRKRRGSLDQNEKAFKEKLDWMQNKQFDKLSLCF